MVTMGTHFPANEAKISNCAQLSIKLVGIATSLPKVLKKL